MRSNLQAQTATCVMNSFGISVNTWTKLRDGKPIRRSVAARLIGRLGKVGGYLPERHYADRGVAEFNRDPAGRFEYDGDSNLDLSRSDERRVGKECVRKVRARWEPDHYNKSNTTMKVKTSS